MTTRPPEELPAQLPFREFVALMALMMSLVALAIDVMLPALARIGQDLGVSAQNDNQLILSVLFLGLALGQMVYGPLSDSRGRKPAVLAGFALFALGCLLSILASDLSTMLVGRFLQGLGLAGPRVVSVALIRDQYEGPGMARVMSFVVAVFIFVPMIAPALGQLILEVAPWRAIFVCLLALGSLICLWFMVRQPETLAAADRVPFSLGRTAAAVREIASIRASLGYTLTAGLVSGAFLGYLTSSQQILQQLYAQGDRFPLLFAALALCVGAASFLNGRLVLRFRMQALAKFATTALCLLSLLGLALFAAQGGKPPLGLLMAYLAVALFCVGILFGNLNALAMEPLGHIAGLGAAVVGSLTTLLSIPVGTWIGRGFNDTVLPMLLGFALCAALARGVLQWTGLPEAAAEG
ncbi:MAG: multidrug effflux MFS transporter [Acidobacteriota bacterium]